MELYRIYRLDQDGHVRTPPVTTECQSDAEAIALARRFVNGTAVEVWKGTKRVYRFEPAE